MKWIEIKGSVGEQMLRYTLALSMNKGGDEVGVTGASEKFHATFPALPRFQQKRISLTDWISRAFGSNQNDCTDWLSYKYAESLGNNIHSYFSIAPSQIPADFASIMPKLQCDNVVAVHVVHSDKGLCSCTPDYYNWAISGMQQWLGDVRFVVLTDNLNLTRQWLKINTGDAAWVQLPQRQHTLIFHLMQQAAHCITSGTIESWWGAWLNNNPDKIVVVPKSDAHSRLSPLYWTIVPIT